MQVFRRIRDLREDRDLSQEVVANYLQISQPVYSRYENGRRELPVHIIIALSNYYEVSVDYILGLTNEKIRYPRVKKKIY